ncbi:hypothetical protein A3G63_00345 [Candidatus Kaiserbacteria bacterium RIFCSPLOWO2_12_FULL_52_8]|uniref:Uncharacterized protein n=1 Tax=Candidatus Kaiserbacteria bacterium RIFCSPHIGHO2_01_FULL_53_31 TaxID=1798481 RepID=A0A1F6CHF0_9BACT|nr:MAG: hypothetical protein A2678_02235 [Candidatus Kaiserbacteria bacterium RIFCSPHIGHO2_01_FULL_53_31]OGG92610.1 MAG: hypothetical protein A3G63_00345 [Candidatus Kaiserbacteria bacterium RIFCSPLOWO2_12_FULL_52_8]
MNIRRLLPSAALVIGTMIFSIGIQVYAGFTEPPTAPPNADAFAPLNTSGAGQVKNGGLTLNWTGTAPNGLLVPNGNVGIGTASPGYKLDVNGTTRIGNGTTGSLTLGDSTLSKTVGSYFQMNSGLSGDDFCLNSDSTKCLSKTSGGGDFGSWQSINMNQSYTASGGGFVVVNVDYANGGWGDVVCRTRIETPVGTSRQYGAAFNDGPQQSMMSPVRSGDTVRVWQDECHPSVAHAYWIPLGSGVLR